MLDNAEWLAPLNYIEFLRDIGVHFSVNRMLSFETYKMRLETGLSFIEFNYQLLQSYDYLVLFRKHGCRLQMGGDDQWGNIVAGMDLIRRVEGVEAFALTSPLITRSDGKKMGKSEGGALFLAPHLVSPYEFYQFWVNVPDADLRQFFLRFTFLAPTEIERCARRRTRRSTTQSASSPWRSPPSCTARMRRSRPRRHLARLSRLMTGPTCRECLPCPLRAPRSRRGFRSWIFSCAPDCASPRATPAGWSPRAGRT